MNALQRVTFTTVNAYIKKEERSQINNLNLSFKELEKEEQTNLKASRRKEIIKIRTEINKIENRKTIERSPGEGISYPLQYSWVSLVAQMVKNPPAMKETWVRPLDWEDPLEKGTATHSSILVWRILWTV